MRASRVDRQRPRGAWALVVGLLVLTLGALSVGGAVALARGGVRIADGRVEFAHQAPEQVPPVQGNPFLGRPLWVNPSSGAAAAAETAEGQDQELLARLAAVPTSVWLVPEVHPVGEVGDYVSGVVAAAQGQTSAPVFTIYGIPGRDCEGGHSAGGLDAATYATWVREIAEAAGNGAIVILEPDALASGDCGTPDRVGLLARAVDELAGGPVTYIDAGHSNWVDAAAMADLLRQAGVDKVRGFALNVSGYADEDGERAYGERIVAALGGGHFVVDTGRGGAGASGEWCNPPGRAVGAVPTGVASAGAMDARLWVKPPGESDGTCGGGPEAGVFWPQRALELVRAAGW